MDAPSTTLDPRTPVIVGAGQVEQRVNDPAEARSPVELLIDAARAAQADSGSDRLLGGLDTYAVIRILSHRYADPAALVVDAVGPDGARTIETDEGGNYPMSLLNKACLEIRSGASEGWLIGGAESWRNRKEGRVRWEGQDDSVEPTLAIRNEQPLGHPGEWARKIFLPIEIYPLFENALAHAEGWGPDEHRRRIGELWSDMSQVAATNPYAWIRQSYPPDQLVTPSESNRMVSWPYTKLLCSNNAVDQSACFVVCSVQRARELGVPAERWVFPWAGADAHEHWYVSHRQSLSGAPAIGIAGRRAMELAGVGPEELGPVDVYSCFPSAVQIAARELGLDDGRRLTVTGGLSFAGGPWNNYVSHSIATMTQRLREAPDDVGLVTANGGFLTKHSFGVLAARPPAAGYLHDDVQDEVDALPRRDLAEEHDGEVEVESATVTYERDGSPARAIVATLLADGRRAWGTTDDREVCRAVSDGTLIGETGRLHPDGRFDTT